MGRIEQATTGYSVSLFIVLVISVFVSVKDENA